MMPELNPFSLISIFIFVLSLVSLFFSFSSSHPRPKTPCPRSYPIIGNLIGLLRNHHRFYDYVTDQFSDARSLTIQVNGFIGLYHIVATVDPANLEHLLKSNFHNYVKGSRFNDNLFDLLGFGIFNADSELWSVQRKIASHEFNTKSLKSFISHIVQSEISNRLIPYLKYACEEEETLDLQTVFQKFAFDNICNLAFGVDPACLDLNNLTNSSRCSTELSFVRAFDDAAEICASRLMSPIPFIWKVKRFLNVGSEKRLKDAIGVIDDYAMEIIRSKEEKLDTGNSDDKKDLLSRFMCSNFQIDFNSPEARRKFYRDIVVSFMLAGKDSTSSALTWFFWLIAGHPQCERLIYDEIARVMTTETVNYDGLKSFDYLHAALTESMRLFPPVPMNSRITVRDDVLPDGTQVKKGWFADYSAYAMGRMESVWGPDCRIFKPERWLDGGDGAYQPFDQFKFPVFHCGPRICLGKEMAYVQMKSVAAALIYNFEIVAVDGGGTPEKMWNPPYNVSLLLRMKGGLHVKLKRRQRKRNGG
ncbi:hypothetical protein Nepgr_014864 [Nepenthes gracilis]|uniref:Cytochrome P450 n=1 Tax=Nepenthes gracilis TaxID=150966 RepID=A0AAD3SK99_NEPGR|nr:hypothetical protein Nepgr_014864 [Nepenthes gracilis]